MKSIDKEYHPIAQVVDAFLGRLEDINDLHRVFYPGALRHLKSEAERLQKELTAVGKELKENPKDAEIRSIRTLERLIRNADRLERSRLPSVLQTSLFNALFSAYDAFVGELLTALYQRRPDLLAKMNRSISASEILRYTKLEDIKSKMLSDEIESFRRKSCVEQFEDLESSFGLKLREFPHWGDFVECSQRRNLFTHCDGIVSDQYLKICNANGYSKIGLTKVGDRLEIGLEYFITACELMAEVSFKLAHVLWRKVLPTEMSEADKYLNRTIYDVLLDGNWKRAQTFGEFAVSLPKFSSDLDKRISIVNYVIALKSDGKAKRSRELLASVDWSATASDFKIAFAVLSDDFNRAVQLMEEMGKSGELLTEESYHVWPLFNEFRQSEAFLASYQRIYGRPFVTQLQKTATTSEEKIKGDGNLTSGSTRPKERSAK